MINWNTTAEEQELITGIVNRVQKDYPKTDRLSLYMDISATHLNGNTLKLAELLADDFNFYHDVAGIQRHINRKTGKLENCFVPRYSENS
jgi:hypothetical protein